MPPGQRRTVVALLVVLATTVATLVGDLFATANGGSLWWLPAAVAVLYLPTDRLRVTVPVVALARLVASLVATSGDPALLPRIMVSTITVAGSYGLAAWGFARLRARHDGRLSRTMSFVVAFVVAGPVLAAASTQLAFVAAGLTGLVRPEVVVTRAIGDAAAIVTLVPIARTILHREWDEPLTSTGRVVVGGLAAAGLAAGTGSLVWSLGGEAMLFLGAVPVLAAAIAARAWIVRLVIATTGLGIALAARTLPGDATLETQAALVVIASVGLVITALLRPEYAGADRAPLTVAGITVTGRPDILSSVARHMRHVRAGLAAVLALEVLVRYARGWEDAPMPMWAAILAGPLLLLTVNALSRYLDDVLGQSLRRQLVETAADGVTVLALYTALAPLTGPQSAPLGLVVALAAAALRLPPRIAIGSGFALVTMLTGLRILDPFPWAVVPSSFSPASLLPLTAAALLVVWLVAGTSQLLHRSRDEAASLAARLDVANSQLTRAIGDRESAYEALALRSRELERATAEAVTAAEHERQARDDYERFASIVAHDLASPMATLQGIARTLQRTSLDEETRDRLLGGAANSASRAAALVDRLHEHASAGSTSLHLRRLSVADVVATVVADLGAGIDATGSTVTVEGELPPVVADEVLLGQLMRNVVANALRHGADETGVAEVTIAGVADGDTVELTVSDRGPGIDPAIAEDLFTVGVRGRRSRGLGLGMATCRTIVDRHGGDIAIGPGPGGTGTTATVRLPAADRARRTVLVVEDDGERCDTWRQRLADDDGDVEVVAASSVDEATALLRSLPVVDAALLDVRLRDGDGMDLLDDLTRLRIPVRVVAGSGDAALVRSMRARGVGVLEPDDLSEDLDAASLLGAVTAAGPGRRSR